MRQHLTGALGEPHLVEVVACMTREAHPLKRKLLLSAAPAALGMKGDILVAVAVVDGRGDAGAGASIVLARFEVAKAQELVVVAQLGAALEMPTDGAMIGQRFDGIRDAEREDVGAVAVTRH